MIFEEASFPECVSEKPFLITHDKESQQKNDKDWRGYQSRDQDSLNPKTYLNFLLKPNNFFPSEPSKSLVLEESKESPNMVREPA